MMKDSAKFYHKSVKSKIRRIVKISISEEIAKQIMDLISKGNLIPGQRLPSERELCETFGASRSSLREALRCLSIVGVLNTRIGEGTSVAIDGQKFLRNIVEWRLITERHDIENLLEVRIALEGVSAAKASLYATQEDIEMLRKLIAKMKASIEDKKAFAHHDLKFHVMLANMSENALLGDLIALIRSQLLKAVYTVLLVPHALPDAYKEHLAIFEAIERHDSVAARKAMQAHLEAHLRRFAKAGVDSGNPRGETFQASSDGISEHAAEAVGREAVFTIAANG
jgi:GntR family transcriptional repressor for pyruvate dehydrogenase complex